MRKQDLDKRICDVGKEAENTQTFREFINESCIEFYGEKFDLDNMDEEELNHLLDHVDDLWGK